MSLPLLTIDQALDVIRREVSPLSQVRMSSLEDAIGYAIAEDLMSSEPNPRFDNSAVDGYGIGVASDAQDGLQLQLVGSIAAGTDNLQPILPGTCRRILTGAKVPEGTYGIAMQEDVDVRGETVILKQKIKEGGNIRRTGADFVSGETLLDSGTVLNAGSAAMVAFTGKTQLYVYELPSVCILTTGDELVGAGQTPAGSQIRDTNSIMLTVQANSVVHRIGGSHVVRDSYQELLKALEGASIRHDAIVVAGGASVGDKDFLSSVVSDVGSVFFHGVSMRPGKPFLFGKIGQSFIFGLPGNPASAFVCFEVFVREALQRLCGWKRPENQWITVPAGFRHRAAGREDFVRVIFEGNRVVPTEVQGSFGLRSLATATALARFPAQEDTEIGFLCPVLLLR